MKTQIKVLVFSAIILIIFDIGKSNAQWIQIYNGPGNGDDEGKSMVVDGSGNVYITGTSLGSGTGNDYATIKYNSSGDQMWIQRYNGPGDCGANSIALDSSGNVYVTGGSLDIATNYDFATVKYNSSGVQQWIRRYNGLLGNGYDIGTNIAVDRTGNVYVTGTGNGNLNGEYDIVSLKYDSNGNLLWVQNYRRNIPNSRNEAAFLAVDADGNMYVTGYSSNNWISGSSDLVIIKYNSSGSQMWVRVYNGTGNNSDYGHSIAVDYTGNVYVTGFSTGILSSYDCITLKYNSSGIEQWVRTYNSQGNSLDDGVSIAIDNSSNIYVAASSSGFGTESDIATLKYNLNGDLLWIQRYNGPANGSDGSSSIVLDRSGNIYVGGYSAGTGTYSDFATIKYNSSGIQQWVQRYNGPANSHDMICSLAIDSSENVYTAGYSAGIGTGRDYTLIKYLHPTANSLSLTTLIEGLFNSATNQMVKDTIIVYIRNENPPFSIIDSSKSELDSTGNVDFNFLKNIFGKYIAVKHRNSIETWSSQGLVSESGMLSYDFTNTASTAYGNNLVLKGSKYCIYSGDVNQDKVIDLTDVFLIYNNAQDAVTGYINTDLTGDNFTDLSDLTIAFNNSNGFIISLRP